MDPVWTIGPLKAELISRFPLGEIVQFHDLITNDDTLKALQSDPQHVHVTNRFLNQAGRPDCKRYLAAVAELKNPSLLSRVETLIDAVSVLTRSWDYK